MATLPHPSPGKSFRGFTLIELIIVIVITGIIGAIVAVFMKTPIDAYFSANRRAALTDTADAAIRRMTRDIHKALPNSIRTNPGGTCVEFIPTRTGGRYRAALDNAAQSNILDFSVADNGFDMLALNNALPAEQQIVADRPSPPNPPPAIPGDLIAIFNLGAIGGNDAYAGANTALVTGIANGALPNETTIAIAPRQFPIISPRSRFYVIPGDEQIVSFVCDSNSLFRNANYGYAAANSCPVAGGALLARAQNLTCNFTFTGAAGALDASNALVQLTLTLTESGETITLYMRANVNNIP